MNFRKYKLIFLGTLASLALCFTACEIDTVNNPNAPTLEDLVDGASLGDLDLLAAGLESVMRNDMEFHYWTTSIIARDYYDLRGTDPRYTGELLGAGDGAGALDNNGFLTTRSFAAHYRIVRNAENLITATENNGASLSAEQVDGIYGFAKTLKAYGLLMEANRQFENGIRLDTKDPDNLGPFTNSYAESLDGILAILDDAAADLSSAGDAFAIRLSSGFAGYDTPGTFLKFNRALYARAMLYAGKDKNAIITELGKSFLDTEAPLSDGVYHVFGTSGNDIRNPLFNVPNVTIYTVHPSWLADAEDGDQRVEQKSEPFVESEDLTLPITLGGLSGDVQVTLYDSPTAPVPIIKNEELVLIWAEAHVGVDNQKALDAINLVRAGAGLDAYDWSSGDEQDLIDQILHERRYSLYGEGHRWIDMRRFNRLAPPHVPLDRPGDEVFDRFPRPVLEG